MLFLETAPPTEKSVKTCFFQIHIKEMGQEYKTVQFGYGSIRYVTTHCENTASYDYLDYLYNDKRFFFGLNIWDIIKNIIITICGFISTVSPVCSPQCFVTSSSRKSFKWRFGSLINYIWPSFSKMRSMTKSHDMKWKKQHPHSQP